MATVELPDDIAAALAVAAAEQGVGIDELAARLLSEEFWPTEPGDALGVFIASIDTGDPNWASTDTAVLRKQADARRSA